MDADSQYHPPLRTILIALAAASNNIAFGYDVGVISGSLSDMAASLQLSTIEQEMATSGLNFVSGIGALIVSGNFLDKFGRKPTLLIAAMLLFLGSVVVTCTNSFAILLLGRALQGLGSGSGWCACTVYITEIAPKEWRGFLVSISDIAINLGILLGYTLDRVVNLALSDRPNDRWRVAMGLSALLPLVYCCCCHPLLPESPRWLVLVGRDAEAAAALRRISSSRVHDASIEAQLTMMRSSHAVEATWFASLCPTSTKWRRRVLTAMALGLAQQLTGTEAILYYTPRILDQCPSGGSGSGGGGTSSSGMRIAEVAGGASGCTTADTIFLISLGVGFSKLFGELIAASLVERTGRRRTRRLHSF